MNPFMTGEYNGHLVGAISADDRLSMVRRFSMEQCQAALKLPDLQKTVEAAIHRRMRTLRAQEQGQ